MDSGESVRKSVISEKTFVNKVAKTAYKQDGNVCVLT